MSTKGYARVVNARVDMSPDAQPEDDEVVIPVDRTNPVLGNPFPLRNKLDRLERAKVIALYQQKLDADCEVQGVMWRMLGELAERVASGEKICLQCHCKPLDCHADLLVGKINEMVGADTLATKG